MFFLNAQDMPVWIGFLFWIILIVDSYLPDQQLTAIYDFYDSLNGNQWTICQWNLTFLTISDDLPSYYCGLEIDSDDVGNDTNDTYHYHTVIGIYMADIYPSPMNLNGTIPDSIDLLTDLEVFLIYGQPLLSGPIPSSFCDLKEIWRFALWDVNIEYVPTCVGANPNLIYFSLWQSRNISISDSIFTTLCSYAPNLVYLELSNVLLFTGEINQCIGNDLLRLENLVFQQLVRLKSTLPSSFSNFTNLVQLQLIHLPGLYGSLPPGIFINNPNLNQIYIEFTNLNGSIPSICNNLYTQYIAIWNNHNLIWKIPQCVANMTNLIEFIAVGSPTINGKIPEICGLQKLQVLYISQTSISGTIPHCLFSLQHLQYIGLNDNNLNGVMPPLNNSNILSLTLHKNVLEGSISDVLVLTDGYPYLEIITFHANQIYDEDISQSLKLLFLYSHNLQAVTMYGNQYIGGNIPIFEKQVYLDNFHVLAAQNLDIGGRLPNNLYLGANVTEKKTVIALYNNRLCSDIPMNMVHSNQHNNSKLVIISGNFFSVKSNDIPNWMKSSKFVSAEQLYLTRFDHIKSWIVLIIGIACCVMFVIKIKMDDLYKNQYDKNPPLVEQIKITISIITNYKFITIILCCCVFYPFLCKYYSYSTDEWDHIPVLSYFCLFFFDTHSIFIQLLLCILMIGYNVLLIKMIHKFITSHKPLQNISQQIELQFSLKKIFGVTNDDSHDIDQSHDLNTPIIQNINDDNDNIDDDNVDDIDNDDSKNNSSSFTKWIRFLWYLFWYGTGVWVLLAYIMSESLPNDNILNIYNENRRILTGSIYFVMAINNSIITPNFIHSLIELSNITQKHCTKLIMISRTFTSIIIPLFASFILLNDCNAQWTHLWNPCLNDKSVFDVHIVVQPSNFKTNNINNNLTDFVAVYFPEIELNLLNSNQVCEQSLMNGINWNRCIRSFLYKWCNLLMIKMIIMCIMPLFVVFYKNLKAYLLSKYHGNDKKITIKIDCEYAMITSKLEIIFIFAIFCPLLYPITLIAMSIWMKFYQYVINKLKWKTNFKFIYNHIMLLKSFPFYFLIFGLIVQQSLSVVFIRFSMNNVILSLIMLIIYIIIDLILIFKLYIQNRKT